MNLSMTHLNVLYTKRAIPITLTHASKTYLIAFPMKTIANRARETIHSGNVSKLYLSSHIAEPSKEKTDQVLYELGLDPRSFHLNYSYNDTEANLHIPRMPHQQPYYQLMERSLTDMILYPFVKNIGLILPLGIVKDTEEELVLETQIVDPNAHFDLFRKNLEASI